MDDALLNLEETSDPGCEPVSLDEARAQCRIIDGFADDDGYLEDLITEAREYCEGETGRAFVQRTFQLRLDRFPYALPLPFLAYQTLEIFPGLHAGRIHLPRPPLASVDAIHYVDANGVEQLLDPSLYKVEKGGRLRGRVAPAFGTTFPPTRCEMGAVAIDFTAGYSADASKVPRAAKRAMLLLVGHWYRNREAIAEINFSEVPLGVASLLAKVSYGGYG